MFVIFCNTKGLPGDATPSSQEYEDAAGAGKDAPARDTAARASRGRARRAATLLPLPYETAVCAETQQLVVRYKKLVIKHYVRYPSPASRRICSVSGSDMRNTGPSRTTNGVKPR